MTLNCRSSAVNAPFAASSTSGCMALPNALVFRRELEILVGRVGAVLIFEWICLHGASQSANLPR